MTVLTHTGVPNKKSEKGERRPQEAVRAVAGVLDTPQLSSSRLSLPAHPLSVEAVMDLESEILWPVMAGMARGQFLATAKVQEGFFDKHLASWIGRFFSDLERAEAAEFYRQVGSLGRLFVETETEAFMLPTRAEARNREDT
jgi:hypothetical protein